VKSGTWPWPTAPVWPSIAFTATSAAASGLRMRIMTEFVIPFSGVAQAFRPALWRSMNAALAAEVKTCLDYIRRLKP
jgi:hypothetical protein